MTSQRISIFPLLIACLTLSACSKLWGSEDDLRKERLRNPDRLEQADETLLTPEERAIRDARRERDEEFTSIGSRVEGAERDKKRSVFDREIRGTVFVEVIWRVPNQKVDRFHLHYGRAASKLDGNIVIPVENLERFTHPIYGPTFRYKLFGMSPEQATFVSLQAENENGISPRSPVLKIPPISELQAVEPR